ncbi:MAG: hypothetical protein CMJ18_20180 [Phycisphaeraceae bacterium]|nr:hypothetical protein [Phycisphaeraceae bacterium]
MKPLLTISGPAALLAIACTLTASPIAPDTPEAAADAAHEHVHPESPKPDATPVDTDEKADPILDVIKPPAKKVEKNPLGALADAMGGIAADLAGKKTDKPVQDRQQDVIRQLDQLIEMLEQSSSSCSKCQGGGSASSPSPSQPLDDSRIIGGPGGVGDLRAPSRGKHQLISLDPKQREAIIQSMNEGFPAAYESILQDYYRRLARQRVRESVDESEDETEDAGEVEGEIGEGESNR